MGNSQYESAAIGHTQVETYQTVGNQPKASASSVQQYQPYQLQGNEHLQIQQKLSTTIVAAEKLLDPLNVCLYLCFCFLKQIFAVGIAEQLSSRTLFGASAQDPTKLFYTSCSSRNAFRPI